MQQRVVLSQGQLSALNAHQQIILPANFQGLKVISVGQSTPASELIWSCKNAKQSN